MNKAGDDSQRARLASQDEALYQPTVSAGGVIIKLINDQPYVLLVQVRTRQLWVVPKGHVEGGESLPDAAFREVREETGAAAVRLIELLGTYQRAVKRVREDKTIHYFLMTPTAAESFSYSPDPKFGAVKWWPLSDLPRLALPEYQDAIKRAQARLPVHHNTLYSN